MNTTPSATIPEVIAQYFAAANRFDAAGATECFTPDAVVHDEQKAHVGHPAIQQWIAETSEAARPQVAITRIRDTRGSVQLVGRVTGDFPGSPLELDYAFLLQNGKIAQLTIQ